MEEDRIHSECYVWFHNQFPELRGLLCYNLNNSKNRIDGNRNKAKGLQKGRSDMVLYYSGRAYMIEIKTLTGSQSTEQRQWQKLVESHGFSYSICRGIEEFRELIIKIMQ